MKTELLNEYIFSKMVGDEGQSARRRRQRLMEADGASDEEINKTPITREDLRSGLELLNYYRDESLKLLQESLSEPPK